MEQARKCIRVMSFQLILEIKTPQWKENMQYIMHDSGQLKFKVKVSYISNVKYVFLFSYYFPLIQN